MYTEFSASNCFRDETFGQAHTCLPPSHIVQITHETSTSTNTSNAAEFQGPILSRSRGVLHTIQYLLIL
jgi:hypothetical protein